MQMKVTVMFECKWPHYNQLKKQAESESIRCNHRQCKWHSACVERYFRIRRCKFRVASNCGQSGVADDLYRIMLPICLICIYFLTCSKQLKLQQHPRCQLKRKIYTQSKRCTANGQEARRERRTTERNACH